MTKVEKVLKEIRKNPGNVRFSDLCKVCDEYFGDPRKSGGSHCVYKMPWAGDPRVNIQDDNGDAKTYQVKQVLKAIDRLENEK